MTGYAYDRTGERIDVPDEGEPGTLRIHPSTCDQGWIEVDGDAALVAPCPTCRPSTVARLRGARRDEP